MKEPPQQYVQRIPGYVGDQDPLTIQAQTATTLERLIAGASPSQLRRRPAPGKWAVAEILAHLADVEIVIAARIQAILVAPGTPIQPMDQDALAAAAHYDQRGPRNAVA